MPSLDSSLENMTSGICGMNIKAVMLATIKNRSVKMLKLADNIGPTLNVGIFGGMVWAINVLREIKLVECFER
jgi:hypothetical protein